MTRSDQQSFHEGGPGTGAPAGPHDAAFLARLCAATGPVGGMSTLSEFLIAALKARWVGLLECPAGRESDPTILADRGPLPPLETLTRLQSELGRRRGGEVAILGPDQVPGGTVILVTLGGGAGEAGALAIDLGPAVSPAPDTLAALGLAAPVLALFGRDVVATARLSRQTLLNRLLEELLQKVGRQAPEEELLEHLCAAIFETFGVDRVSFYSVTGDRRWLVRRTARDRRENLRLEDLPVPLWRSTKLQEALAAGQSFLVEDVEASDVDPELLSIPRQAGVRALIGLPVADGAGLWGVAFLSSLAPGPVLSVDDRDLCRRVLQQAAPILQNVRMMRKLSHSVSSLAILFETSQEVSSTLDLSEVPKLVARKAIELTGAEESALFLMDESCGKLRPVHVISPYEAEMMRIEIAPGEGITGCVVQSRVGEIVNRVDLDARSRYIPGTPTEPEALLAVPLVCSDRIVGAMTMYKTQGREFNDLDLATMNIFGTQVAIAIENARLFRGMAEERTRLLTMLEQLEEAVFLCDPAGRISLTNPAARLLAGGDPGVGRPLVEVVPAELGEVLGGLLRELGEPGARHLTREVGCGERILLVSFTAISGADDEPYGLVGLFKDITDLKSLESQILQSSKMSAVGQLASGVAHEFNNLIAAIYGYAQFMKDNREGKLFDKGIRIILSSSERARDLTRSLLTFSRATEGRREALDLNEVVDDALLLVEQQLSREGIRVVRDYERLPHAMGERGRLQEVFLNLVTNAMHAMPDGGVLTLRSRGDGRRLVVEVSDTGVGIPPESLPRIFEPFFTTKGPLGGNRLAGTGLGLYMVYNIVRAHGGQIDVSSDLGKGTLVRLTFPAGHALTGDQATPTPARRAG